MIEPFRTDTFSLTTAEIFKQISMGYERPEGQEISIYGLKHTSRALNLRPSLYDSEQNPNRMIGFQSMVFVRTIPDGRSTPRTEAIRMLYDENQESYFITPIGQSQDSLPASHTYHIDPIYSIGPDNRGVIILRNEEGGIDSVYSGIEAIAIAEVYDSSSGLLIPRLRTPEGQHILTYRDQQITASRSAFHPIEFHSTTGNTTPTHVYWTHEIHQGPFTAHDVRDIAGFSDLYAQIGSSQGYKRLATTLLSRPAMIETSPRVLVPALIAESPLTNGQSLIAITT
ncbi:MAG: hypothetical protein QY330_04175 [Candidatus Dojkabacteria bacterium]|uniref:Uncharacterized protein n=2 Tax=Candidatus Dojkabacteria TaxID=74243 RepID=A0A136KIX1_9BACT|nr:MAG: hypothetical protein UZ20_WS6002000577 [candidate division WS6 bacterium OLB21]MBW7953999.1 hypothetical protein [Candidatus Dojkabacteria bacterium]WKZ27719.1 MAG: hypothetical protein QY330_04175 [Candidatus Dojkabacteria bacterium]